ncbi:MAG: calcium/sodium antiporter [Nitratireductor sp.]|nr:calcium/sodium antiporter [Nitratireductor sp.]
MLSYAMLLAGLVILLAGGDLLVRGAVGLAERFRVPPLIIGLTIVALGTSAPEMMISVKAALDNAGGIAIGNVVGSNIANVFLVLAMPALIKETVCNEDGIGKNIMVMIGMTLVFMGMLANGTLARYDGLILLVLLALFLYDQYKSAVAHRNAAVSADYRDEIPQTPKNPLVIAGLLIVGLVLLPLGADMTVNGATDIARTWGVSEEVIGLTIVAVGTSLPELATSLLAVWRNNSSVALGNVVGSNIFNIGAIMGVAAAIAPIPVAPRIISVDIWVMLAAAGLVAFLAHYKILIDKKIGGGMLAAYGAYTILAYVM